jgi:C4-dicarboxylate transporter, DctQ subunit
MDVSLPITSSYQEIDMIGILEKVDDLLAALERLFITLFSSALVLILMAQVILRYVFSSPLFWAEEISVQLLVFLTFIGLSILLKKHQMIAIDMVIEALPEGLKRGVSILLQVIGLAVILFFAYQGTLWILRPEVRMELSPTTQLPIWINYSMFPITFYCMAFHMTVGLATMVFKPSQGE